MTTLSSQVGIAQAAKITIDVADHKISEDSEKTLITYALGSCIGVTVYDPVLHIGGMLHYMLPKPPRGEAPEGSKINMYGATGIPLLFRKLYDLGAEKSRLIVCAAGAAEVIDDSGTFTIGARNRTMMRKLFWKNDIVLAAEDTGGKQARTMSLRLSDGAVTIRSMGKDVTLWDK